MRPGRSGAPAENRTPTRTFVFVVWIIMVSVMRSHRRVDSMFRTRFVWDAMKRLKEAWPNDRTGGCRGNR